MWPQRLSQLSARTRTATDRDTRPVVRQSAADTHLLSVRPAADATERRGGRLGSQEELRARRTHGETALLIADAAVDRGTPPVQWNVYSDNCEL